MPNDAPFSRLTKNHIDKASCPSVGVGRRDAAVKPTGMYLRRPAEGHEALSMYALVFARLRPRRRLGLHGVIRPVVLRVAAFQLFSHLLVTARPECREVLSHLYRTLRR